MVKWELSIDDPCHPRTRDPVDHYIYRITLIEAPNLTDLIPLAEQLAAAGHLVSLEQKAELKD